MASHTSSRRDQSSSNETNSSQRSAWSTALERQEKEYRVLGMNEILPNTDYIEVGKMVEARNISAIAAGPQMSTIVTPANWVIWQENEPTKEELGKMDPKAIAISYRYHIIIDDSCPIALIDEEYVGILDMFGLDTSAEWTTFTVVSRGMLWGDKKEPVTLPPVLQMAMSPDHRAIVVYDMEKENDVDGDNLPKRAFISDILHWCYVGFANDPSKLQYFITHPIYQIGTQQVMEDALKAKGKRKENMVTYLPSDSRNYSGHLPNPWHGLLGTRHGRVAPYMLVLRLQFSFHQTLALRFGNSWHSFVHFSLLPVRCSTTNFYN
jgi:hypothetical protein